MNKQKEKDGSITITDTIVTTISAEWLLKQKTALIADIAKMQAQLAEINDILAMK